MCLYVPSMYWYIPVQTKYAVLVLQVTTSPRWDGGSLSPHGVGITAWSPSHGVAGCNKILHDTQGHACTYMHVLYIHGHACMYMYVQRPVLHNILTAPSQQAIFGAMLYVSPKHSESQTPSKSLKITIYRLICYMEVCTPLYCQCTL